MVGFSAAIEAIGNPPGEKFPSATRMNGIAAMQSRFPCISWSLMRDEEHLATAICLASKQLSDCVATPDACRFFANFVSTKTH